MRWLRFGLFVQVQPAAGHARRNHGGPDPARSHGRAAASVCRRGSTTHQLAFNRSKVGTDTQVLIERKGRHAGPDDRQVALAAVGPCRNGRRARRHGRRDACRRRPEQPDRRAVCRRLPPDGPPRPRRRSRPRPPRARVRPALPARALVRRLRPPPDHDRGPARRAHRRARQQACRSRARPTPPPAPATC